MTFDDALKDALESRPDVIYLGGKTSTGKSTFAGRLKDALGYHVIELDQVVSQIMNEKGLTDDGYVFGQVYKLRERLDWVHAFVRSAQARIKEALERGEKIIVEGAVAHPETLQELLSGIPGVRFFYFHPRNLEVYERNLTRRFMTATRGFNAGLPRQFWQLVKEADFAQFCDDRVLTDTHKAAIHAYALSSRQDSEKRLAAQAKVVKGLEVVEI